ncbi:MAG: hypothetical protein ACO3NE_08600 [Alphaproteobacteria bacterium]
MSESNQINYAAFQWEGENELWTEMMQTLREYEMAEMLAVQDANLDANQRAFACGRSAAVSELIAHFEAVREMARGRKE